MSHNCGPTYLEFNLGGLPRHKKAWNSIWKKQTKKQKIWGVAQVVQCLSSKCKTQSSITNFVSQMGT
jgi:hypothetical protein